MANDIQQYYYYTHKNPAIITIGDFVNDFNSIVRGWQLSETDLNGFNSFGTISASNILSGSIEQELLMYSDTNDIVNLDRLFSSYTQDEAKQFQDIKDLLESGSSVNPSLLDTLPLKVNTILALPHSKLNKEILITEGNQLVESQSVSAFLARRLVELLTDPNYKKIEKIDTGIGVTQQIHPDITVWVWCRALSRLSIRQEDLDGTIINITPFIQTLQTNVVGNNGGNFNFTLPPIIGEWDDQESVWKIKPGAININESNYNYTASGNLHDLDSKKLKRNNFYFNRIINENDVVFIRFESLKLEAAQRIKDSKGFEIGKEQLPGRVYDMIGLVDNNAISVNPASNDVTINIAGRDLMKLFIEDGTYFYPNAQFTSGGIFGNENDPQRLTRFEGKLQGVFQQSQKTIDQSLKFIINALGNISICPDSLFAAYGDKRSQTFQLKVDDKQKQNTQIQNNTETGEQAKKQIQESGRLDKIRDSNIKNQNDIASLDIDQVFNELQGFLTAAHDAKVITEINEIPYWDPFTFGKESIKEHTFSVIFDNELYIKPYVWKNEKGHIITDSQKNKLIASLEAQAALIKSKQAQAISTTSTNNNSSQDVDTDNSNGFIDVLKTLSGLLDDAIAATIKAFGVETPQQQAQKAELQSLQNQYEDLRLQIGEIKRYPIKKTIESLNSFGVLALKLTWQYIKELNAIQNQEQQFESQPLRGIWQIIKLVIDGSVSNRQIIDPSLGNEMGSLVNALRKICQEPFVELYSDTYGDQFYLIARKLPFDKEGFKGLLKGNINIEAVPIKRPSSLSLSLNSKLSPSSNIFTSPIVNINQEIIIDIADEDIISEDLTLGNEAYVWYRLQPQNLLAGNASDMAFTYLKAVYFKEYADIWGSKPLDMITNYIPYFAVVDNKQDFNVGYFTQQGIKDLKYLVDSHAYLPFVRKGTIRINNDRRIKRGTMIRVPSLGEIFYVEGVTNDYSISDTQIDRTTTLQVSHGMVERFFDDYFKIIDTDIDPALFNQKDLDPAEFNKRIFSSWKVNRDIFNFFLKKGQFQR